MTNNDKNEIRGKPVSGRPWKKVQRSRFSSITYKATVNVSIPWEKKILEKKRASEVKELQKEMIERKKQEKLKLKEKRLEKEKRKLENELKNSTVQTITRTDKIKTMNKKQLRQIKKTRMTKHGVVEYVPLYN